MAKLKDLVKKMSKIKEDAEKQIEKIKTKAQSAQNKNFDAALKVLFKEHPKLESFSWCQYTPNWNDGDECTFSANTDYVYINGSEEEYSAYSLGEKLKNIKNKKKTQAKLEKELQEASKNKNEQWRVQSIESKLKELEEDPTEVQTLYEMTDAVTSLLNCFNNDMLYEMFGDHAKVTVTANGAEVEQYEHD